MSTSTSPRSLSSPISELRVILVETETPGNLGACARAMKSMGLRELRLVNPRRRHGAEAIARAVSARDLLENAREYSHLSEALADCGLVIAASGKLSGLDLTCETPEVAMKHLWEAEQVALTQDGPRPALILGRESSGLTREELGLCNRLVMIPTDPVCPSLNLGSALQILAYVHYQLRLLSVSDELLIPSKDVLELATHKQQEHLIELIEKLAVNVGALNPHQPRQMITRIRHCISRAQPRKAEASLLQSILGRALQKLKSD